MKKLVILFVVFSLSVFGVTSSQANPINKMKKDTSTVTLKIGKWRDVPFNGDNAFTLNGERTLWAAQLHVTCKKAPKYIKMRFARHLPNGKIDSTGTNTWMLNGKKPNKSWQGSLVWETSSDYPMTVQYKIMGGKNCKSGSRQFKYWQPGDSVQDLLVAPTG
jgi:hypothetical protein